MVRAPGRINLIGEHTDYNDGFVFPAAIDKAVYFAVSQNNKGLFRFYSVDFDEYFEMKVSALSRSGTVWANYLLGVARQFVKAGHAIRGVNCVFGGDIPVGAGLSSSAALETGFAFALNRLFNCDESLLSLTKMAQKAEHEFAGVMCGIMDQFAILQGKKGNAMRLDCRSLDFDYAPLELSETRIVLCNTKIKHALASSEYNSRRKECEQGVQILKKYDPSISALRDAGIVLLEEHRTELGETVFKRCKYVLEENNRVNEAFPALQKGDVASLGQLLFQSHEGLKNEFEVSCGELDLLVDLARRMEGVSGARMMGGGFGGCTINLVQKVHTEDFAKKITESYRKATGTSPEIYVVKIAGGTGEVMI